MLAVAHFGKFCYSEKNDTKRRKLMSFDYKKIGLISGILLLLCIGYVTLAGSFSYLALSNALFMCALIFLMIGIFSYLSLTDFFTLFLKSFTPNKEHKNHSLFTSSSTILFFGVAITLGILSVLCGIFLI